MRLFVALSLMFSLVSGLSGDWLNVEKERDDFTAVVLLDDPATDHDWIRLGNCAHRSAQQASLVAVATLLSTSLVAHAYQPQSPRGPPLQSA